MDVRQSQNAGKMQGMGHAGSRQNGMGTGSRRPRQRDRNKRTGGSSRRRRSRGGGAEHGGRRRKRVGKIRIRDTDDLDKATGRQENTGVTKLRKGNGMGWIPLPLAQWPVEVHSPKLTWNLQREPFEKDSSLQRTRLQVPCFFMQTREFFSQNLGLTANRQGKTDGTNLLACWMSSEHLDIVLGPEGSQQVRRRPSRRSRLVRKGRSSSPR